MIKIEQFEFSQFWRRNLPTFKSITCALGLTVLLKRDTFELQNISNFFFLPVGGVCNFLSSISSQQKFEVMEGPALQPSDGPVLQLSFI